MNRKPLNSLALTALIFGFGNLACGQSAFFQAVTNLSPAAYWPLQETAQPPAADVETNFGTLGAVGTAYYSSTNFVRGIPGAIISDADPSVNFRGVNGSFLAVPLADSRVSLPSGPFTVEAWIFPTNANACTVIAQTGVAGTGGLNNGANSAGWSLNQNFTPSNNGGNFTGWSFHVHNGAGSSGGAESSAIVAPFTLNTWYHVVCVFDGVNVNIYVNGDNTTHGQIQIAMTGSYVRDLWSPLTIGCGRGLNNNRFGGALDEISIYTNALSATQIGNHYFAGVSGSGTYSATVLADNPYMYWRLNAPVVSTPALSAYPPAGSFGSVDAGGVYLQGTTPGVAGPPFGGFGSPSYACAFNGIGGDATNGIPYSTNGVASPFVSATGSGIVITNVDSALNKTTNNISAMVWFKSNPEDGRFQSLIGHGDSSWRFSLDGTTGRLRWNPGEGGELTSVRTYNDGKWHFVVGVYTNSGTVATGTNYLYVDGVFDTSGAVTGAAAGSSTNVMIGGAPDYSLSGNNGVYRPQRHFAGSLAHAAYLTNALDPVTIQSLYDAAQVPPAILAQPAASPGALAGGTNIFNSIISGSNPKTIRWFYNTVNSSSGAVALNDGTDANGSFILGVTNSSLAITNLKVADSGYYFVTAANSYGAVTSILSHLTANSDPLITAQNPSGAFSLFVNQSLTLSVTASGLGALTYQWYTNGVADTAAGSSSTYSLTSVQLAMSGTTYQCVVTDTANSSTTTSILSTLTVITPPSNQYASAILGLNPDGYWPMHEVAPPAPGNIETNLGTLGVLANGYYADWSASSGVITRRVPGALAGSSDPAVFFNQPAGGTSPGYLLIPHTSPLTSIKPPFTFETWVKPLSSAFGDIVSQGAFGPNSGAGTIRYGVRLCWGSGAGGTASQTFSVFVGNGTTTANNSFVTPQFSVAQWYHLVLTFDATNWALYVNGSVYASPTATAFPLGVDISDPICVGQGLWGNSGPQRSFPGEIDEVAIYTNALSASDVQAHYAAGTTPNPNPTYDQAVLANSPTVYLRMNAPAYTPPPISSWPVVTNYGKVAGNGVYTPGLMPGLVPGPSAGGNPVANLSGPNVMPGNGMSSFADVGQNAAFNPTTNAFSYSAWFRGYPGDIRSFQTIIGHSDNSFRAAINSNGRLQVHGAGASASDITTSQVYNDGNWHQFALTFSGTNASILLPGTNTLYVDGVQVGTSVSVGNAGTNLNLLIGSDPQFTNNPAGPGRTFAGSVCEVAFWNNLTLSSNQVFSLWNAAGIPAFITSQPVSASVNQGVAFTNTVGAGGNTPLSFRWFYNAVSNYSGATAVNNTLDGRILGATSPSLIMTNVLGGDAGFYFAIVTNNYAAATSSIVSLSVFTKPIIGAQFPIPYTNLYTLFAGASPTFSLASVSGAAPISYQWYTNGVKDTFGTNATYQLHNVQIGGITNFCVVSNFVGSATSMVWAATVIPAPTAPYPQSVLGLGPIAYLRLNEADNGLGNGNPGAIAHDYLGGNDGIYTNVTLGQPGYAQGLAAQNNYNPPTEPGLTAAQFGSFPPIDNYAGQIAGLDFSGPANTTHAFSIGAWVNASLVLPNGAGIVTKGYGNGGEQFDLDIFGNTFRFFVRDAAGGVHGPTSAYRTDGNWHHVVGVCDQPNGFVALYVDGLLVGQSSIGVNAGILSTTHPISIGARRSGVNTNNYDFQFQSFINDVAIYNYALTATQVQSNYFAAGIPPYIAVQPPASVTASEGGSLTISASVIGTAPLAYQWSDSINPSLFAGQTNATLVLSNIPVSLNGDAIFLTTTNIYGATNTSFASLTVNSGPPALTASNLPPRVLLPVGKSFTYSVQASGTLPLSYQWYAGATPITGATASSFTVIAGPPGSTNFSVVITNIHGSLSASSLLTVIPLPTDQYSTNILALHPVGYWPLQETAAAAPVTMETNYGVLGKLGNAYYAINDVNQSKIGFGVGGALTGDPDSAVSFSGAPSGTNYAFVPRITPALTMMPPLTFEAWVNSSSTAFSDIIGQGGNGLNSAAGAGNWGGIRMNYGGNNTGGPNLQIFVANGNGTTRNGVGTPANSLPVGLWHHCVATYDGTNALLYVDGTLLLNTTALSGANTEAIDTWSPLTIGDGLWQGSGTGPTRAYTGLLDEVAIYTNILSGSEVSAHYAAGTVAGNYKQTVLNDGPLLYYRMDAPGFITPDSTTYATAVNYGSAPVNGAYPGGIVPGGIAGPPIAGLGTSLAAPGNGILSCVDAGNDPTFNPTGQQPFSTLLWFKGYPGDARVQTLMSHGTTNWAMNLDGTTGRIVWNLFNGGQVTSTNILNDGNWHNLAGVFNGTTSSLYVDGVINSSGAAPPLAGEPNAELFLGGNQDFTAIGVNQRYFAGALAQVALFTNALSSAQISNLYNLAVVVSLPTITLTRIGDSLVITYTGTLLSAPDVQGPYTPVLGAASPYTVPTSGLQRFFRTKNP